jgi:hypothetical protein
VKCHVCFAQYVEASVVVVNSPGYEFLLAFQLSTEMNNSVQ